MQFVPKYSGEPVSLDRTVASTNQGETHRRKARLLIADDEPRLLMSLCSILQHRGFEVDAAKDGHTACRQAESFVYDLIVLNLRMPGKSGFEVMSWLRDKGLNPSIIIISGFSDFHTVRRAFRLGASDFLRKPYDVDELIQSVNSQLQPEPSLIPSDQKLERLFQLAFDQLPDPIFALDKRMRMSFLNHRAEQLLGSHRADLVGRPFTYLVHDDDLPKASRLFDDTKTLGSARQELKLRFRGVGKGYKECEINIVFPFERSEIAQSTELAHVPTSARVFGSIRDVTERKQTLALMEFRASHDALTGLPNRTLFLDRLALAVSQAARSEQQLAVLFIDLNDFKHVNDTFGHNVGDELLRNVAARLKMSLREGDTLSRYGGDEFTVLLPSIEGPQDASVVADKLLQSLSTPMKLENDSVRILVKVCIGIALYPEDGADTKELLNSADKAMYRIKEHRLSTYSFFNRKHK